MILSNQRLILLGVIFAVASIIEARPYNVRIISRLAFLQAVGAQSHQSNGPSNDEDAAVLIAIRDGQVDIYKGDDDERNESASRTVQVSSTAGRNRGRRRTTTASGTVGTTLGAATTKASISGSHRCELSTVRLCRDFNNRTSVPNLLGHQSQGDAALEVHAFTPLIQIQCSPSLKQFLCSVYVPPCSADNTPVPPCQSLCLAARDGCQTTMNRFGFEWPETLNCSRFPVTGTCIAASSSTVPTRAATTTASTSRSHRCELSTSGLCRDFNNRTSLPNLLGHQSQGDAALEVHQFTPLIRIRCSPSLQQFLCSVYSPPCSADNIPVPPCQSLCLAARDGCQATMNRFGFEWPETLDCSRFPVTGDCIATSSS